jgi:hypothetical protein
MRDNTVVSVASRTTIGPDAGAGAEWWRGKRSLAIARSALF